MTAAMGARCHGTHNMPACHAMPRTPCRAMPCQEADDAPPLPPLLAPTFAAQLAVCHKHQPIRQAGRVLLQSGTAGACWLTFKHRVTAGAVARARQLHAAGPSMPRPSKSLASIWLSIPALACASTWVEGVESAVSSTRPSTRVPSALRNSSGRKVPQMPPLPATPCCCGAAPSAPGKNSAQCRSGWPAVPRCATSGSPCIWRPGARVMGNAVAGRVIHARSGMCTSCARCSGCTPITCCSSCCAAASSAGEAACTHTAGGGGDVGGAAPGPAADAMQMARCLACCLTSARPPLVIEQASRIRARCLRACTLSSCFQID